MSGPKEVPCRTYLFADITGFWKKKLQREFDSETSRVVAVAGEHFSDTDVSSFKQWYISIKIFNFDRGHERVAGYEVEFTHFLVKTCRACNSVFSHRQMARAKEPKTLLINRRMCCRLQKQHA